MARVRPRRPSPAERARAFEREQGITPAQRTKAGSISAVAVVALLVLGVVAAALLLPVIGVTTHGDQRGRGQVVVEECHADALMRECIGLVTTWQGQGPRPGQRVSVLSRSVLSGTVDVVLGTETISRTNRQQGSEFHDADLIIPADAWVMPQWLRPVTFLVAGAGWVLLAWWLSRTVLMASVRRMRTSRPTGP